MALIMTRQHIVSKYNVIRTSLIDNETTPLQVGNGNFAFGIDNTGMQVGIVHPFQGPKIDCFRLSFHSTRYLGGPGTTTPSRTTGKAKLLRKVAELELTLYSKQLSDYTGVEILTYGRNVSYDIPDPSLPEVTQWLVGNPNRINLGRIGLRYNGDTLAASQMADPRQELDLWNGVITSTFNLDGKHVKVVTQGDFESDSVVFRIESVLISTGILTVELDFPYPPIHSTNYKYEVFVGVYNFPNNHTTKIVPGWNNTAHIYHELQETNYFVNLRWPSSSPILLSHVANATEIEKHRYTLDPIRSSSEIFFTASFSPEKENPAQPTVIQHRNTEGWNNYWKNGGFVDLTASSNSKADELQRRIILSQYNVRVNSAATGQSPQESGLMNNGWYGKYNFHIACFHC